MCLILHDNNNIKYWTNKNKQKHEKKHIKPPIHNLETQRPLKYMSSYDFFLLSWFSSCLLLSAGFFIFSIHQTLGKQFVL